MKRRLYQLDVFTDTPFAGNPLAVVIDGDGLSPRRMLAIAREMNLSETVFVQKPTGSRALARLRIFTTHQELPLAGHPVIGTWFLLATLGVVPAQDGAVQILQQTGSGILPVEINFRNGRPSRITMTQKPAKFRAPRIDRDSLARALGLSSGDLDAKLPIEQVSTGMFNLMVPMRNRLALKRIAMDTPAVLKLLAGKLQVLYCFAQGARGNVFARGMLPWSLQEDAATGSAAGSLAAYLVRHKKLLAGEALEIVQGVEMGRPSKIHIEVVQGRGNQLTPRVSGNAVLILEGTIEA